jgi:hypothetical protein
MVVKCIRTNVKDLDPQLNEYAVTQDEAGNVDLSLGKYYQVYACRENELGSWFFVHTDTQNLAAPWWMPASLFEVTDQTKPQGWVTKAEGVITTESYDVLFKDGIEEGLIDGDSEAVVSFAEAVDSDPSFPSESAMKKLNKDFLDKKSNDEYADQVRMARESGYEFPDKPSDL